VSDGPASNDQIGRPATVMTHCLALRPSGAAQSMSTHLKERRAYSKATTKTGAVSGRLAGLGFFVIVAFSTPTQSTRLPD
jgi:hypothetical protein